MLYAVVDIETTGGYAASHGITEIAILVHDGDTIIDRYETLINPNQPIPIFIQALTGITNQMVMHAPTFAEVAEKIYSLLQDKVFVAHNVNFDYSFIRHHLDLCGYVLHHKKLCTVRLSRKIFPGLASYSLGKLCAALGIPMSNRHRAGGDAAATAILLGMLIGKDTAGVIDDTLKRNSKEQRLPPNLPKAAIDSLPNCPGVYYFKDEKGKVIYVGKAKSLKKRVNTHFVGNNINQQRQAFLKSIYSIDVEPCGTELMAFILEAVQIKKLWPANNRAMKRFEQHYSLYYFEDQKGYKRLGIDKYRKNGAILYRFNNILDGHQLVRDIVATHKLCEKLCYIQKPKEACTAHQHGACNGACIGKEPAEQYNLRVNQAIAQLQQLLPSFALIDQGRSADEQSCLWVERGQFYGMGYIGKQDDYTNIETLKSAITPYPTNDYIMNMIISQSNLYPNKIIPLTLKNELPKVFAAEKTMQLFSETSF